MTDEVQPLIQSLSRSRSRPAASQLLVTVLRWLGSCRRRGRRPGGGLPTRLAIDLATAGLFLLSMCGLLSCGRADRAGDGQPTCQEAADPQIDPGWSPLARFDWAYAHRRQCPETALAQLSRVLPDLSPADGIRARLRMGLILHDDLPQRQPEAALMLFREGATQAAALGEWCIYLRAQLRLAEHFTSGDDLEASDAILEDASRHAPQCPELDDRAAVLFQVAALRHKQRRELERYRALEAGRALQVKARQSELEYDIKLAELRHDLGDVSDGGLGYRKLLERAHLENPQYEADLYIDLAYQLRDLGQLEDARDQLLELLAYPPADEGLELTLNRAEVLLAWIEVELGELDSAEERLSDTPLALFDDQPTEHGEAWQCARAELLIARGRLREARAVYQDVLDLTCQPESLWRARLGLARIAREEGRLGDALELLWAAVSELEEERRGTAEAFWSLATIGQRYGLYELWLDTLIDAWLAGGRQAGSSDASPGWDPSRHFQAGAVTADDLLAAVEKISSQAFTTQLFHDRGGPAGLAGSSRELAALQARPGRWTSGAELRAGLPRDVPVMVYQPLDRQILLLEVWAAGVRVHLLPMSSEGLQAQVDALDKHLEVHPESSPPELDTLGRLLLEPVRDRLPTDYGVVGFVLQGPLERVPVAALRLNGHYLVQQASPFELINLRAAVSLGPPPARTGPVRALGVSHGDGLKRTGEEIALLERPGFQATLLSGPQATLEQVQAAMVGKDLIHFALHASKPKRADLQTSPLEAKEADLELEGGTLDVDTIQKMQIQPRLAVLSACETGVGQLERQESRYGALNRAMLLAGAEATIGSRWQVGDEPTYALMSSLYEHYPLEGRARALADAQRAMLESGGRGASATRGMDFRRQGAPVPFAAPWSWAGFSLIGAWD